MPYFNRQFPSSSSSQNKKGSSIAIPEGSCNKVLLGWLVEWWEEAVASGSKVHFTLKTAIANILALERDSLADNTNSSSSQKDGNDNDDDYSSNSKKPYISDYKEVRFGKPVKLRSGAEAMKRIKGIGPALAAKIDKRITKHISDGGHWEHITTSEKDKIFEDQKVLKEVVKEPAKKRTRTYVPALRSQSYGILLGLLSLMSSSPHPTETFVSNEALTLDGEEFVSKNALQQASLKFINQQEGGDGFGTALAALLKKGLIEKSGNSLFALTDPGHTLALKLMTTCEQLPATTKPLKVYNTGDGILKKGCYSVHLLLDTREIRSRTERDFFLDRLRSLGVSCEVRQLPLGDVLWVAKPIPSNNLTLSDLTVEVVLDHIVERKRVEDLAASIVDKRFSEQKVGNP